VKAESWFLEFAWALALATAAGVVAALALLTVCLLSGLFE
jgi:hypothetical protein